jgi:non-specific protein-tyrosine kinase
LATTVKTTKDATAGLVAHEEPKSAAAEAYPALRTNNKLASPHKPVHTHHPTTTTSDDGNSTTLANLAITFATAGSNTILVDADLRRPHLHTIIGLGNDAGLTTFIADMARSKPGETPHLPLQDTMVDNLQVLTSGPVPPNPAEMLASQRMGEIIALLRSHAEYILIDTPPIIAVTDAAVLAPRVDGVILVVNAGKTRRDLAVKARDMLNQVNAHILGVVLNNAQVDRSAYAYYGK